MGVRYLGRRPKYGCFFLNEPSLSSCSKFFTNLFLKNSHNNYTVNLKDIKYKENPLTFD